MMSSILISEVKANLDRYRYNPSNMQRVIFDHLQDVNEGAIEIVDPSSPFVFLLESSTVNTSLAMSENLVNLRRQYASLAKDYDELYLHMSDEDYLDRFAKPAETKMTLVIQLDDMFNKMVYDYDEQCHKVTIPANTRFTANSYTFTSYYPIHIRKYNSGVLIASYDPDVHNPLKDLSSNIITPKVRKDTENINWLFLEIEVGQFSISSSNHPVQKSSTFSVDIPFSDKYYYCRVYHKKDGNSKWVEILTTHTDQVYDSNKPTAVIKVFESAINVFIPLVYMTNNSISGDIRIDVITTKGSMSVDLSNYSNDSFGYNLITIDEETELTPYVNAMSTITAFCFSKEQVTGGSDNIDFKTLRERVIFNSIGDRQLPITNVQLDSYVSNRGFDLVKNVDVITNRIFLAVQKLPAPVNKKLLTAANIGINTFITNVVDLITYPNVKNNTNRITISSNTLFKNENGIIRMLRQTELDQLDSLVLSALVNNINSNNYLYCPYYYVLDMTEDEFEVRAYDLDRPTAKSLNYIYQNYTLQLPVNTGQYTILKTETGYKLRLVTNSGNFYKLVSDNDVSAQLAFRPVGENKDTYILGTLVGKTSTNERIYEFDFITNYDLDSSNNIHFTNTHMVNNSDITVMCNLDTTIKVFYTTTSLVTDYVASEYNSQLGMFMLPDSSALITYEELDITFGYSLKNIWTRSRSLPSDIVYEKYTADIPLLYDHVVYDVDPVTNSIFSVVNDEVVYNILHNIGDPVLDGNGDPVYKHRVGDVVLDNGVPVISNQSTSNKEIDMLFVDGKYYFLNDDIYTGYKNEITSVLTTWITDDIYNIQKLLLEQTKIFFYPKSNLSVVKAYIDKETEVFIPAEQSFSVEFYVSDKVFKDSDLRTKMSEGAIKILDKHMDNTRTVNMTDVLSELKTYYGDTIIGINISGLGGTNNYMICNLANEHNRLCLKKKVVQQQDNTLHIVEDVTFNFVNVDRQLGV